MQQPSLLWFFFGLKGRISRIAFLLGGLAMTVITLFVLYRITLAQQAGRDFELWETALGVIVFVSLWCQMALAVKRFHDIGRPGLLAVVIFLPLINFIAFVALCLYPGDPGPNQHGERTNAPR